MIKIIAIIFILIVLCLFAKLLFSRKSIKKRKGSANKDNYDHNVTQCCSCNGMATRYIDPNLKEHKESDMYSR